MPDRLRLAFAETATRIRFHSFGGISILTRRRRKRHAEVQGGAYNRQYWWRAEARLDSVYHNSWSKVRYDYDAQGRLVRKWRGDPNGWTFDRLFLYDGDQLLVGLDANLQRLEEYAYAPGIDRPIATIRGATSVEAVGYPVQDELGNIIGLVEGGAAVSQTNSYDAWGTRSETGYAYNNRLLWKGLQWEGDVVSLHYMRNPWYDYETGRFMSEDPIGLAGGINLYAFAGNDPINGRDPYGLLYSCEWFTVYGYGMALQPGWASAAISNTFPVCIDTGDPEYEWREYFPVGEEQGPGRRRGGGRVVKPRTPVYGPSRTVRGVACTAAGIYPCLELSFLIDVELTFRLRLPFEFFEKGNLLPKRLNVYGLRTDRRRLPSPYLKGNSATKPPEVEQADRNDRGYCSSLVGYPGGNQQAYRFCPFLEIGSGDIGRDGHGSEDQSARRRWRSNESPLNAISHSVTYLPLHLSQCDRYILSRAFVLLSSFPMPRARGLPHLIGT